MEEIRSPKRRFELKLHGTKSVKASAANRLFSTATVKQLRIDELKTQILIVEKMCYTDFCAVRADGGVCVCARERTVTGFNNTNSRERQWPVFKHFCLVEQDVLF
jgi:hypothetical protein